MPPLCMPRYRLRLLMGLLAVALILPVWTLARPLPRAVASAPTEPTQATAKTSINFGGRIVFMPLFSRQYVPGTIQPPQPSPTLPDVEVSLYANPDSQVGRGNNLTYELRVRNKSKSGVANVAVALAFDGRLALTGSRLSSSRGDQLGDVQKLNNLTSQIVVTFGSLRGGEARSGKLIFKVEAKKFRLGDTLGARASYTCQRRPTTGCQSNTLSIAVGSDNGDRPGPGSRVRMAVEPDRGTPGTRHRFSTDAFQPGEQVVTWLNTPSGIKELSLTNNADSRGRVAFELTTRNYAIGDYGFVAYGKSSKITALGPFRVQGPGGLSLSSFSPRRHGDTENTTVGVCRPSCTSASVALATTGAAAEAKTLADERPIYGSGGIAGKLTNSSNSALGGVLVLAYNADGALVDSTRSQSSGTFLFPSGLTTGVYTVEIMPSLSLGAALGNYADKIIASVVVSEPNLTRLPTTVLQQGASISGKVTALAGGAALADVPIFVYSGTTTETLVAATSSEADGSYSTEALPVGSYTLEFAAAQSFATEVQGYSSAQRSVEISSIASISGIDVALARVTSFGADAVGQISGKVTAQESGAGLEDALVAVSDAAGDLADLVTTDASGAYTTSPLSSGVYTIEVLTLFSSNATTGQYLGAPASPSTATVTGGAVVDAVNAQLARGGSITGTLLGAPTGTLTRPLALANVPVLVVDTGSEELAGLALTDATGAYTISSLADGLYSVYFAPQFSDDEAAQGYIGAPFGSGASGTAVRVQPPLTEPNINATLSLGGRLSGQVTAKGTSAPLAEVLVLVYGAAATDSLVSFAASGSDGRYTTPALPSGSYKLAFLPSFATTPETVAFLTGYSGGAATLAGAAAISVSAPATTANANAQLTRGAQIRGRISAADSGDSLGDVLVLVYSGTTADTLVAATLSNDDGSYATPGLPAGTYRLEFDPSAAEDPTVQGYQGRFGGGATSLATAEAVTLVAGATVSDKHIALPPADAP